MRSWFSIGMWLLLMFAILLPILYIKSWNILYRNQLSSELLDKYEVYRMASIPTYALPTCRREKGIMEYSENMEYRGFSSHWCCFFVELPWITQDEFPRCNAVRRLKLVVVVPFSTDQSVFCNLQDFFQVSFQTLKHTSTQVIWTLMLIIMYIQIIVISYTLVVSNLKIFWPSINKFIF